MKGREGKGVASSADLLVCFPSRAHLSLMPKSICSPARGGAASSDHTNRHRHPHHRRNKSTHAAAASPLIWTKNNNPAPEMDEPTSPKVTCAGQIKVVRPTTSNWHSVMEEIERIHNHKKKQKKKTTTWADPLGFKKDILHFLTCLRTIRLDFRCFGSFPHQADIIASDDEEYETQQVVEAAAGRDEGSEFEEASTTVFSKWFMVLQEDKGRNCEDPTMDEEPAVPPPNALFLMRCRSAPAHTRLLQTQEEEEARDDENPVHHHQKKKRESLAMVMKHDTDFNKSSPDIAKDTWVVMDPFSRSTSWKRW